MESHPIHELEIGQSAEFAKTVTETDIAMFCAISGDFNPIHVDADYAAGTPFGARVAHGPLTLALSAGVLGMRLPGLGSVAVSNHIDYRRPVYIGDTITTRVEVAGLEPERNRATMAITWRNQAGELVAEGEVVLKPPQAGSRSSP
jgi:3-hydroxybutyryl-CoA dehydratase